MFYRHRHSFAVIAVVAAAVSVLTAVGLEVEGQSSRGPASVAVVDVQQVFQNLDQKGSVEAEITQRTEELQKQQQKRQQEIQGLQSDLQVLSPESDAYQQTRRELRKKAYQFDAWKKMMQRELEAEKAIRIEGLYRNVLDACKQIAQDKGLELILQKDELPSLRGQNQKQLTALILQRKVLYADKSLNITDQVIQICNNRYNNPSSDQGGNGGQGGGN